MNCLVDSPDKPEVNFFSKTVINAWNELPDSAISALMEPADQDLHCFLKRVQNLKKKSYVLCKCAY